MEEDRIRAMNWWYCLLCSRSTAAQGEADDEAEEDGGWEGVGMRCRAVGLKRVSLRDACASRSCLKDRGNAELAKLEQQLQRLQQRALADGVCLFCCFLNKLVNILFWSHVKYV